MVSSAEVQTDVSPLVCGPHHLYSVTLDLPTIVQFSTVI